MKLSRNTVCAIASVLTLLAAIPAAEAHTFTSPDGRTLEAEIVSSIGDTVTLKLANGQTIVTQTNKFSTDDQAYITEWKKRNISSSNYKFSTEYSKDKEGTSKRSSGGVTYTTENWVCNIKLTNTSGQPLNDLTLNYEVYYSQIDYRNPVIRKVTGSAPIASISHGGTAITKTVEVPLVTSQLQGGYIYGDGSRARKKDTLEGVAVKVSHEGKVVYEWASSGVPKGQIAQESRQ